MSYCLIYAADLADRLEHLILPALKAGAIVLADRYIYTAFARDAARGVNREWIRSIYRFAVRPTAAFYFRVPLNESLQRILIGRPELKYYEAGMDLGAERKSLRVFPDISGPDPRRIRQHRGRIRTDRHRRHPAAGAATGADLKLLTPYLKGAQKVEHKPWREVLAKEGLYGRYLNDVAGEGEK